MTAGWEFVAAFFLAATALFIAFTSGFFRWPHRQRIRSPFFFQDVVLFVLLFFFVHVSFSLLALFFFPSSLLEQLGVRFLSQLCLFSLFLMILKRSTRLRLAVWRERGLEGAAARVKDVSVGIAGWLVSYPVVLACEHFLVLLFLLFFRVPEENQIAVNLFEETVGHPLFFSLTVFELLLLVPFNEEILFRGVIQSWLRSFLNKKWAIVITSFLFAALHVSMQQGWKNVEIFVSLFVLSLFLGFVYERQQSLFAPVALHAVFNGMSMLFISLS